MAPMVADAEETEYFVELGRELGLRTVGVMAEVPSLARARRPGRSRSPTSSASAPTTSPSTRWRPTACSARSPPTRTRGTRRCCASCEALGDAGRASGKPVGICGEAAADPQLAVVLVGLGATSLSMTPAALADVRPELGRRTLDDARAAADAVLTARTAAEARAAAERILAER